uniref:Uncharacterized protein n=1 Tax=Anguilla anguilla TaxID=7936 RepID=A0A0E9W6J4_ANGAN
MAEEQMSRVSSHNADRKKAAQIALIGDKAAHTVRKHIRALLTFCFKNCSTKNHSTDLTHSWGDSDTQILQDYIKRRKN